MNHNELDIALKQLELHEDVARDILENLVFNRKLGNLHFTYQLPRDIYSFNGELFELERDVLILADDGLVHLFFAGLENESASTRWMPLRALAYTAATYMRQMRDVMDSKTDTHQILPVFSVILYFGNDRNFNGPRHLRDLVDGPMQDFLEPYVNDWIVHVFNVGCLTEKTIEGLQSDLKAVADFKRQLVTTGKYVPRSDLTLDHVPETMTVLSALAHDDTGLMLINELIEKKKKEGNINMESVFQMYAREQAEKAKKDAAESMARNFDEAIQWLMDHGRSAEIATIAKPGRLEAVLKEMALS